MTPPAPPGRPLAPVPTLDELAQDPALAAGLPSAVARDLLARLAGLQAPLLAAALSPTAESPHEGDDQLLDVAQAAKVLRIAETTLYRRAKKPPLSTLVVSTGTRRLLFSRRRIEEFVARSHR